MEWSHELANRLKVRWCLDEQSETKAVANLMEDSLVPCLDATLSIISTVLASYWNCYQLCSPCNRDFWCFSFQTMDGKKLGVDKIIDDPAVGVRTLFKNFFGNEKYAGTIGQKLKSRDRACNCTSGAITFV